MEADVPYVPEELVRYLERVYPQNHPTPPGSTVVKMQPHEALALLAVTAGRADVVMFLRQAYEEQREAARMVP